MYGFSSVFLGIAVGRIFYFLRDLFIMGSFNNQTYYGDWDKVFPPYDILLKCAYASILIGAAFGLMALEKSSLKSKYFLTTINVICIIFIITFSLEIARTIATLLLFFDIAMYFISLFIFYKNSSAEFQPIINFLLLGFIVILAGHIFDTTTLRYLNLVPSVIPPLLHILGVTIAMAPIFINPKILSRIHGYNFVFFSIFVISIFIIIISNFEIQFINPILVYIIIWGFVLFLIVFTIFLMNNKLRSKRRREIEMSKGKKQDFLKIFVKPSRLTEEEVSISKEKKICLVCKGKVSRYNIYICPNCDSFYCEKCAKTLEGLENGCWACETAFDETKPVLMTEKREEELTIENNGVHKEYK